MLGFRRPHPRRQGVRGQGHCQLVCQPSLGDFGCTKTRKDRDARTRERPTSSRAWSLGRTPPSELLASCRPRQTTHNARLTSPAPRPQDCELGAGRRDFIRGARRCMLRSPMGCGHRAVREPHWPLREAEPAACPIRRDLHSRLICMQSESGVLLRSGRACFGHVCVPGERRASRAPLRACQAEKRAFRSATLLRLPVALRVPPRLVGPACRRRAATSRARGGEEPQTAGLARVSPSCWSPWHRPGATAQRSAEARSALHSAARGARPGNARRPARSQGEGAALPSLAVGIKSLNLRKEPARRRCGGRPGPRSQTNSGARRRLENISKIIVRPERVPFSVALCLFALSCAHNCPVETRLWRWLPCPFCPGDLLHHLLGC